MSQKTVDKAMLYFMLMRYKKYLPKTFAHMSKLYTFSLCDCKMIAHCKTCNIGMQFSSCSGHEKSKKHNNIKWTRKPKEESDNDDDRDRDGWFW